MDDYTEAVSGSYVAVAPSYRRLLESYDVLRGIQRVTRGGSRPLLLAGIGGIALILALALGVTVGVIEVKSALRAYVTGESLWSKGQQGAVFFLDRYLDTGERAYLRRARDHLTVPLADRRARLALDRSPADLAAARRGFLEGGNHPRDVAKLIWLYRHFRDFSHFREAVAIWRRADRHILRLDGLADRLEREVPTGLHPAEVERLRGALVEQDRALRSLEEAFSRTLGAADRWLSRFLFVASSGGLGLGAALIATVFWSSARRLTESENELRTIFEHTGVGLARVTPDGTIRAVNGTLCELLDETRTSLVGASLSRLLDEGESPVDMRAVAAALAGDVEEGVVWERRCVRQDGRRLWASLTFSAVPGRRGDPQSFIVVFEDVSETHRRSAELAYEATHDPLTGLYNRREFERRLDRALETARSEGVRHVLCFVDLDWFKGVNDTCGHAAGDALLVQLCGQLQERLREGDVLGRIGGDEFGVILDHCHIEDAERIAEQLRRLVEAFSFVWGEYTFRITASIGLVEVRGDAPAEALMAAADQACYLVKDAGRNDVVVNAPGESAEPAEDRRWPQRLRAALREDRAQLYAQPIRATQPPGQGLRLEVLLRLLDDQGRECLPESFFPTAERYRLAATLDRYVLTEALRQLSRQCEEPERVAGCHINLAGQTLADESFVEFVEAELRRWQIPAAKLCFELSEAVVVAELQRSQQLMRALAGLGCRFALDDYGGGVGAFDYVTGLPVDFLKISERLTVDMDSNDLHGAVVGAVAQVARAAGRRTVAECVETPAQVDAARRLGVDFIQGYAVQAPIPLAEALSRG